MRANIDVKANHFISMLTTPRLEEQTLQMKAANDIWDTGVNLQK